MLYVVYSLDKSLALFSRHAVFFRFFRTVTGYPISGLYSEPAAQKIAKGTVAQDSELEIGGILQRPSREAGREASFTCRLLLLQVAGCRRHQDNALHRNVEQRPRRGMNGVRHGMKSVRHEEMAQVALNHSQDPKDSARRGRCLLGECDKITEWCHDCNFSVDACPTCA